MDASQNQTRPAGGTRVSRATAFRFWFGLGWVNFGGPAGQIAMMQAELVDRRRWIDQGAFLRGLNFCMLLPGPEATQLATYIGWRQHGTWGGVVAGTLFVLPGALVMLGLAWIAAAHGEQPAIAAVFDGVKPAVVAIVAAAVMRIGRRTLATPLSFGLAAAAFVALFVFDVPFPLVILFAGALGYAAPRLVGVRDPEPQPANRAAVASRSEIGRLVGLGVVFLALWAVPVGAAIGVLGWRPFGDIATLFTIAAFVTFGGAYAVLPYVADAAVATYGWLGAGDMVNGLALAESTPGPLILVNTYVGFFAGYGLAGAPASVWAGVAGGLLATYVTFLPSFLFILAAAPHLDRLQAHPRARAGLAAITAAVVGVVLNLAVFLGEAVFLPAPGTVRWTAVAVAAVALAVLMGTRLAAPWLVAAGALFGIGSAALT